MKILLLRSQAVNYKKSSWLITINYFKKHLKKRGHHVIDYSPKNTMLRNMYRAVNKILILTMNKRFSPAHSLLIAKQYGRICSKDLKKYNFDVIFAPAASTEISFLNIDKPIFYWTDVTFKLINNFYDSYTDLLPLSINNGNYIEKKAFENSSKILFPSEWARSSAVNDYDTPMDKTGIVNYGGNIDEVPDKQRILNKTTSKETCNLLFLATEWDRKGGDAAFETLKYLKSKNFKVKLYICGVTPPDDKKDEDMIVYPYLNKKIDSEKKILTDLMYDSHFLFVPTKADCSPIIFAEASAYGMPVISNNVGGVPEMVHHGINGVLFSPDPSPDKYGDAILKIFSDDIQYKHYVHNSRTLYDTDLNWDKWAEKVSEHLEEVQ